MNIRIFDRNAELHAIQVTATLYMKTLPVCGPLLTASKSIQLMLKFAALGREQISNGKKKLTTANEAHVHPNQKGVLFCIMYQVLSLLKAYTIYPI